MSEVGCCQSILAAARSHTSTVPSRNKNAIAWSRSASWTGSARVENSLAYYWALKRAKVPAEMHIYPVGGHGYGLRPKINPVTEVWPTLVLKWMESIKMLPASNGSGK
jgi:hypothetical protein